MKILKRSCLIFFCCFCVFLSFGQKEFANWYFGNYAGLNFNTSETTFHLNGQTFLGNNPATISDSAGNLLFYFANGTIFNRNHEAMSNGEDIAGIPNQFGNLIIPKPNSPFIYYLIVSSWEPAEELLPKIYLSEIDMRLNGNLGGVTSLKNEVVYSGEISLKLTAVQHANDIDFWIVGHGLNNANFLSFRVTENGFNANPVISTIGSVHTFSDSDFSGIRGGIKVSHDAKQIGLIYLEDTDLDGENSNISILEVADFNDITGQAEGNVLRIGEDTFANLPNNTATGSAFNLEFSPNNNFVYVTCVNAFGDENGTLYPSALFQFDTRATNDTEFLFSAAKLFSSVDRMFNIQLGLDGKIYVCTSNQEEVLNDQNILMSLGVIENPNAFGLASSYRHLSVPLSDDQLDVRLAGVGLPQDIRQFFYLKINEESLCGGQARRFELETSNEILSVLWDFGDGNTSTDLNPEHSFAPGNYTVLVTATYENSVIQRTLVVDIADNLEIPDAFNYCDDISNDNSVTISIEELEARTLSSGDCGAVTFHLSEQEAQNNTNPLTNNFETSNNPEVVYLRLEQQISPFAVTITPITINVDAFPAIDTQTFSFCKNEEEALNFNPNLISSSFSGNSDCAQISYHLSMLDANAGINQLNSNFEIPEGETVVFIRVEDISTNQFYTESIILNAKPRPKLELEDFYYICPNQDVFIDAGMGYDNYLWSTGEISSTISISEPGVYEVEVSNNTVDGFCTDTQTFNVGLSAQPDVVEITVNDLSNNNNIEISANGIGDYEYSLDGIIFQDAPVFNNLLKSEYTVYVRDKNGCGTVTQDVFLLIQPEFFTPNQDGVNDYWQVKSAFSEPNLKIEIFNRFGKLISSFDGNSLGWDGTFNNLSLPTNDYWFKIFRPSNGRTYSGHFTLKR